MGDVNIPAYHALYHAEMSVTQCGRQYLPRHTFLLATTDWSRVSCGSCRRSIKAMSTEERAQREERLARFEAEGYQQGTRIDASEEVAGR